METLRRLAGLPGLLMVAHTLSDAALFLMVGALLMTFMQNFALDHETAALVYGAYGMVAAGMGLLASPALDVLPVTPIIVGSLLVSLAMRLVLGLTEDWRLGLAALLLAAGSDALWATLLDLALQRSLADAHQQLQPRAGDPSSSSADRDAHSNRVFALAYALTNVAAVGTALGYQAMRVQAATLPAANTLAMVLSAGLLALTLGTLLPGLRALRLLDEDRVVRAIFDARAGLLGEGTTTTTWSSVRALMRQRAFWAFTTLCTVLLGVRMIFRHLDTTLPVIMERTPGFGGEHAPFPLVQAVNPALIIVLAPLLQWVLATRPAYPVLAVGTTVSALSVLPVVVWPQDMAGYVAFVALFSVGEALWSARFTAYALTVAPPDKQATYKALAALPSLAAKLPTSLLSGWIVAHYCPAAGNDCDGTRVWAWVLGMAASTPLCLWLGWRWLNTSTSTSTNESSTNNSTRAAEETALTMANHTCVEIKG